MERAERRMFVITTDGMENSNHEYTYEKMRQMIECQKSRYRWEFIFLGANIDALYTAARCGIASNRAAAFHADSVGMAISYEAIKGTVAKLRSGQPIADNWKAQVDEDFKKRHAEK